MKQKISLMFDLQPLEYSRDSQGGVSKLSRFGLSGFWEFITPCSDLQLRWGLKQTCSSPWELSNGVLHSIWTHQGQVDSWLLMVGSQGQISSLTPGPSFVHNLCSRYPNGSCEAIFDIYTSRPFQRVKNISMWGVLTPAIELWVFGSFWGLPSPHFGSVNVIFTLLQSGVVTLSPTRRKGQCPHWHLEFLSQLQLLSFGSLATTCRLCG
jgi:hypothetical protein